MTRAVSSRLASLPCVRTLCTVYFHQRQPTCLRTFDCTTHCPGFYPEVCYSRLPGEFSSAQIHLHPLPPFSSCVSRCSSTTHVTALPPGPHVQVRHSCLPGGPHHRDLQAHHQGRLRCHVSSRGAPGLAIGVCWLRGVMHCTIHEALWCLSYMRLCHKVG